MLCKFCSVNNGKLTCWKWHCVFKDERELVKTCLSCDSLSDLDVLVDIANSVTD